ncbi:PP2C family protein-serine/threonine phosphatase [Stieleria marina]|uniref:Serine/threonine phosphatase stp n=1 Tax=Stieleria marina TaxID=1930275 RepID=A0A517NNJ1_9BACT|nr:Serine/threonine phosphatase stp [Planctomycetes bacterium K23_9]
MTAEESDDFTVSTAYGATDVGRKRETNQDQFLIAKLNKSMLVSSTSLPMETQSRLYGGEQGQLLLVADGMGGHAAGEKASSLAVDQLIRQLLNSVHWFFQVDHDCEEDFVDALKGLLQNAHKRILAESAANLTQQGMGTTLTMAHLMWPRMYVVHAGDSRCYLIRDGVAQQLTTDHTLAHQLVEAGGLKPEEEATSRWSNVLWNVLGGRADGDLIAEVRRADLKEGDTVVLCSDGLHRYVDSEKLAAIVKQHKDPRAICDRLIEIANQAGGEDNITVVVSRPEGGQDAAESLIDHADLSEDAIATSIETEVEPFSTDSSLQDTLPG